MIVFGGALFHLVMLAILLELMRTSRVPFKELLLGLCLFGIGICGVSLAGLWPFASPFFPEPNFSSRNLRRNRPAPAPGAIQEPRFSRTAIVGAAWAPFFVVAALSFFMLQSRVVVTVDRHANTSAASVPLALDVAVRDGRIKPGHLILMEAMGGGVTWGASLVRW